MKPIKSAKSRIAVVGSGVAGLGAAWLLGRDHDVHLFEARRRLGGHSNTVDLALSTSAVEVDTGFIVYNRRNYPLFSALLDHLHVDTVPTNMSFSVSTDDGAFEYGSVGINGLLAQRRNLFSPRFHRLMIEILRFNKKARLLARSAESLSSEQFSSNFEPAAMTVGQFLEHERFSRAFTAHYLLPMAAAIWSCPVEQMLDFPALGLTRFFDNHGLLDLRGRPQWRTVLGGSRRYVDRLAAGLCRSARLGAHVVALRHAAAPPQRHGAGQGRWRVEFADGATEPFDAVVLATHADEAVKLLQGSGLPQSHHLRAITYQSNRVVVHQDQHLMPRRRAAWSSWNYLARGQADALGLSVTYWMNKLQALPTQEPIFVTLNPQTQPHGVLYETTYEHPLLDMAAWRSQKALSALQGENGLWLCGSYLGNGFHEDAFRSACQAAVGLGTRLPFQDGAPAQWGNSANRVENTAEKRRAA